jgi:hypothetical protein
VRCLVLTVVRPVQVGAITQSTFRALRSTRERTGPRTPDWHVAGNGRVTRGSSGGGEMGVSIGSLTCQVLLLPCYTPRGG